VKEPELLKQLNTYADAVTAFSFGQAVLFCYALGKTDDFTKSLVTLPILTASLAAVGTALYLLAVLRCHANVDKIMGPAKDRGVQGGIARELRRWRVGIIIGTGIVCCGGAFYGHYFVHFPSPASPTLPCAK
jgi:hypothetical protein